VGPRAVLDAGGEEKNSQSLRGLEPPIIQPGRSVMTSTNWLLRAY